MKNFLKGRLKPLQYLALKYQVQMVVKDDAEVTEYYKNSKHNDNNNNNNNNNNNKTPSGSPTTEDQAVSISDDSYLNIDVVCVDQMLRNLMYTMLKNIPMDGYYYYYYYYNY